MTDEELYRAFGAAVALATCTLTSAYQLDPVAARATAIIRRYSKIGSMRENTAAESNEP